MATLYEIAGDYARVLNFDLDSPEDGEAMVALLDEIQERFDTKADRLCMVMRNVESEAEAYKAEEARLSARRKALENKAARLKEYLADTMKKMDLADCKTPLFSLKFQKNPPAVEVLDERAVPSGFWSVPAPVLDRRAVLEALKAGEAVPGAAIVQRESLRIR